MDAKSTTRASSGRPRQATPSTGRHIVRIGKISERRKEGSSVGKCIGCEESVNTLEGLPQQASNLTRRRVHLNFLVMATDTVRRVKDRIAVLADHSHKSEALNPCVASNIPVDCAADHNLLCYSHSDDTPRSPFAPRIRQSCQLPGKYEQKKTAHATRPQEVAENKQPVRRKKVPRTRKTPEPNYGWQETREPGFRPAI
jgi:hypothetical protein